MLQPGEIIERPQDTGVRAVEAELLCGLRYRAQQGGEGA